jgi:DNA polymerase delta subunit 1
VRFFEVNSDASHFIIRRDVRTEIETHSQPVAKKRKLGLAPSFGSQPVSQQLSFTEVLERLREEGNQGNAGASLATSLLFFFNAHPCTPGAEGGADSWARPPLPPLNEERDKIGATFSLFLYGTDLRWPLVFQQIDVETASDPNGKIILRMFGVTEVVLLRSSATF